MRKKDFKLITNYMNSCMKDMVHDKNHVYRVLNFALLITEKERINFNIDVDAVIIGTILHDIGREKEYQNKDICHAKAGSIMAYEFLLENNYKEDFAGHVRDTISSHRYSDKNHPKTIEAKIIFDADKLDLTGTVGVSRSLIFGSQISEPLYNIDDSGMPINYKKDEKPSIYREYNRKLKNLYEDFYTEAAREIAKNRQKSMDHYFHSMFSENEELYRKGSLLLKNIVRN